MVRWISMLVLPALLILSSAAPADAQWWPGRVYRPGWRSWGGEDLSGRYIYQTNGGMCYVYRSDGGYQFVNENGQWAQFVYTAPNRLEQVAGEWDRNVVCTVVHDRWGRPVLRFDNPNAPTGYWVPA
jgi:hypothetical protein